MQEPKEEVEDSGLILGLVLSASLFYFAGPWLWDNLGPPALDRMAERQHARQMAERVEQYEHRRGQ